MDFEPSARTRELQGRLDDFIRDRVDPSEAVYRDQVRASGDPHFHPPVMEELKAEARERGLWNLFLPDTDLGSGEKTCIDCHKGIAHRLPNMGQMSAGN